MELDNLCQSCTSPLIRYVSQVIKFTVLQLHHRFLKDEIVKIKSVNVWTDLKAVPGT